MLLIDEAHLYPGEVESMLGKFHQDSAITDVLGVTATSIKLQGGTDMNGDQVLQVVDAELPTQERPFFQRDHPCRTGTRDG